MPSLITKRGKKRYRGQVMVAGVLKQKLFPDVTRKSLKAAIEWEEKTAAELRDQTEIGMESLNMEQWIDDYLDDVNDRFTNDTYLEKKKVFEDFVQFTDFDESTTIDEVTKPVCKGFLKHQFNVLKDEGTEKERKRGGNAANKDRKNLAAAWNWGADAYEDDWPEFRNPFEAVRKFPEKRYPRYVPPEDDFWKVYEVAEGQDKVMLLAFLHLAGRKGEMFRVKLSDLDLKGGKIRLWTRKRENSNWECDWLPLTTELAAALKWWVKERMKHTGTDKEHLFVCLSDLEANRDNYGKPFTKRRRFMISLCKRAGVKYFDYHSLRHLTASVLWEAYYPLKFIQEILRHRNPNTTIQYLRRLGFNPALRDTLEEGLKVPARVYSFKCADTEEHEKTPEIGSF